MKRQGIGVDVGKTPTCLHQRRSMIRSLTLAQHTLYADLLEQGGDDLFDAELPENGSILIRSNRDGAPAHQAYYQGYRPATGVNNRGRRYARYLGRTDDPAVADRIERFHRVKAVRSERATAVRALIGAGMPRPDRITGQIIEALARAGLFPDHAVLLGEAAYQTYGGILGVRLPKSRATRRPDDCVVEIAVQYPDRIVDILDAVRTADPSFDTVTSGAATYRSSNGGGILVRLPFEDGAAFAAFLIDQPVQSIILHGPGIPVTVPAPERYAAYAQVREIAPHTEALADLIAGLAHAGRDRASAAASAMIAARGLEATA